MRALRGVRAEGARMTVMPMASLSATGSGGAAQPSPQAPSRMRGVGSTGARGTSSATAVTWLGGATALGEDSRARTGPDPDSNP